MTTYNFLIIEFILSHIRASSSSWLQNFTTNLAFPFNFPSQHTFLMAFAWWPSNEHLTKVNHMDATWLPQPPWKTWVDQVSLKIPTNSTISLILSGKIVYCMQLTAQCTDYSISFKLISPMIWKLRDIISSILITSLSCVCFHYQTTHYSCETYPTAMRDTKILYSYIITVFLSHFLRIIIFYKYLVFHILVVMKWHVIYIMVHRRW